MNKKKEVRIGKWNIPKELFDKYVEFRIIADSYLLGTTKTPSGTKYEQQKRWMICVKQIMMIHREICKAIKIEYTTDDTDEFYLAFQSAVNKATKLRD